VRSPGSSLLKLVDFLEIEQALTERSRRGR
jgi:hypothetical protein